MDPYQKELFSKENLDPYRNDPRIQHSLNGMAILNCNEFLQWYNFSTATRSPKTDKEMIVNLQHDLLDNMPNEACGGKIGIDYGTKAIINMVKSKFDVLFILAPKHNILKTQEFSKESKTALKWKIKHILGFIVVEKGECKRLPNTYSVNLICARANPEYKNLTKIPKGVYKRERARAALLMGGYLYCAKKLYVEKTKALAQQTLAPPPGFAKQPFATLSVQPLAPPPGLAQQQFPQQPLASKDQTMGILELAGGYTNINGFMSYSKMGFVKNLDLFNSQCFRDYGNLPMSVDLTSISGDRIIGLASGKETITDFGSDNRFMKLKPKTERQFEIQTEIAALFNLLYQLEYAFTTSFRLDRVEAKIVEQFDRNFYQNQLDSDYESRDPEMEDYLYYFNYRINELIFNFNAKTPSKTLKSHKSTSAYMERKKRSATARRIKTL